MRISMDYFGRNKVYGIMFIHFIYSILILNKSLVVSAPVFTINPQVASVFDNVNMRCDVSQDDCGNPQCDRYIFYFGNDSWTTSNNLWNQQTNSTNFAGNYSCRARGDAGETFMSNIEELQVHAPTIIRKPATSVTKPFYDDPSFNLSCVASGNNPSIEWDIDITGHFVLLENEVIPGEFPYDQSVALKSVVRWKVPGLEATCEDVHRHDGVYTCTARGFMAGQITADFLEYSVEVQYSALWRGEDKRYIAEVGNKSTTLCCDVCANPAPYNFTWTFNGQPLRANISYSASSADIILFDIITPDDFGVYTCTVTNLINGIEHYKSYDIELLPAPGAPMPPHGLAIKNNASSVSITICWKPGFNMGFEQFFNIYYKTNYDEKFQIYQESIPDTKVDMSATLHYLLSETTYEIMVIAYNGWMGGNNYSTSSHILATTKARPVVEIISIMIHSGNVQVSWKTTGPTVTRLQLNFRLKQVDDNHYSVLKDHIVLTENPIVAQNTSLKEDIEYNFQLLAYEGELLYPSPGGDEQNNIVLDITTDAQPFHAANIRLIAGIVAAAYVFCFY